MTSINSKQIEIIKTNLKNLEIVCSKYPILDSYRKGNETQRNIHGLGLSEWIGFIDFLKNLEKLDIKPYYDEPIKYKTLKKKLSEISLGCKSTKTFLRKSEEDFLLTITDNKLNRRYTNSNNQSYYVGLFKGEVLILNYILQRIEDPDVQKIGVSDVYLIDNRRTTNVIDRTFQSFSYYSREIKLPTFRNLEFDMVSIFMEKMKQNLGEFDFRKCNITLLKTEINNYLVSQFKLEKGSTVKALEDIIYDDVLIIEKDKFYIIESTSVDNNGFLNIYIIINGKFRSFPYSKFEDVSRMRDDLLNELFGDSGS
jgi:hypothetical protein